MIHDILKMGDERLLRIAPPVPEHLFGSAELAATDRRPVQGFLPPYEAVECRFNAQIRRRPATGDFRLRA